MEETAATTKASPVEDKGIANKPDTYIIGIYITLCIFSIVESFSASSREIRAAGSIYMPMLKHLGFLVMGTLLMYWVQRKHYTKLLLPSFLFVGATFVSLILAMVIGHNINGAQRAIPLFGVTVQPAELAKIAVVFILSFFIAQNLRNKEVTRNGLIWCATVVGVFGLLLFMQGLTNMLLFMGISFALLIVGGTKWRRFPVIIGVYILLALLSVGIKMLYDKSQLQDPDKMSKIEQVNNSDEKKMKAFRSSTWQDRLSDYFDELLGSKPYENPVILENDQKLYSYLAQANGGIVGQLPGGSRETSRLPLAFSDYVFSIVTEDTGFIGAVFLLFLYFSLLIRAGNIARRCNRAYPALLVMGMAVMIVLQAFFHMAINTGVFPVSGQNLPLISKGGTSILVIGIAFGVMLSVSRSAAQVGSAKKVNNEEKEALPESMRAANPTKE